MTLNGNATYGYHISIYRFIVLFEIVITVTSVRGAGVSVSKFQFDGIDIIINSPYQFVRICNNDSALRLTSNNDYIYISSSIISIDSDKHNSKIIQFYNQKKKQIYNILFKKEIFI